jgi:hypothetical protein
MGRCGLLCAAGFFLAFQVGLNLVLNDWAAGSCDPEFAAKLAHLRACRTRTPDRPVVLFLGSSRTFFGLRPDQLPSRLTVDGRPPLVFNFGLSGFGYPVCELLCLRRILDAGIQPDWLCVEILPAWLMADRYADADVNLLLRASSRDVPTLRRYWERPGSALWRWWRNRVVPAYSFRIVLQESIVPSWIPSALRATRTVYDQDEQGWFIRPDRFTPEQKERQTRDVRAGFEEMLKDLHVSRTSDQALREILELCRSRGIQAALYIMPEAKFFQSWYSASSRQRTDSYVAGLAAEYRVPLFDARDWVPEDDFYDGHHLSVHGATVFTRRLAEEALPMILSCRKASRSALAARPTENRDD